MVTIHIINTIQNLTKEANKQSQALEIGKGYTVTVAEQRKPSWSEKETILTNGSTSLDRLPSVEFDGGGGRNYLSGRTRRIGSGASKDPLSEVVENRRWRRSALEEIGVGGSDSSCRSDGDYRCTDQRRGGSGFVDSRRRRAKTEDVTAEDLQIPFRCRCVVFLLSSSLCVTLSNGHEEDRSDGGSAGW
ncbi:hypothetical protein PIB30_042315 [Stylosanthes scabra]|uniref:Uncharacterized protein n=1 Tax=Stylosanthes scabra TaxID=79078 RepID=A0ABU6ZDY8_9FABA|nr:hypothetical protein [Stylosanthes scabra]